MFEWCKLDDSHNVVVCDMIEAANWLGDLKSVVGSTEIADRWVSTVFLGMVHSGGSFETAIFGGPDERFVVERYHTWDEAAVGHEKWATSVWKELNG